jgi:hypothetical protein
MAFATLPALVSKNSTITQAKGFLTALNAQGPFEKALGRALKKDPEEGL